jgi:hypothetical protein
MKNTATLLVLGAAVCLVSPAGAKERLAQTLSISGDTSRQYEMSSRQRRVQVSRVVAVAPPRGFTHAPTWYKAYDDWRWPYVSWVGARDSLYVPGPLVTFVPYGRY